MGLSGSKSPLGTCSEEPVIPFEQRNCRQMCCFHIWLLGGTAVFGHPLFLHLCWGKGSVPLLCWCFYLHGAVGAGLEDA